MRSIRHSLIAAATAAAMLTSCIPTFAFAAPDQEGGAPADVPIIDVTVPTSFILEGDAGIDIQDLGEVSATSSFVNNSNTSVRIKEISYDASGLNGYFDVKDTNKAKLTIKGQDIEWVPKDISTQNIYKDQSASLAQGLIFAKGTTDEQKTHECTLGLDMSGMGLKDAAIEATKDRSALRDFMKLSWTFECAFTGDGSEEDSFYLKIKDDASNYSLAPYKGVNFSLSQVKSMAEDISAKRESSTYFDMFKAMAGGKLYRQTEANPTRLEQYGQDVGDASDEYTCKVIWEDIQYDVRVIDVLHDDLSDGTGKAGLTFQFVNLSKYQTSYSDKRLSGGWRTSTVRSSLNFGGAIFDSVPYDQQQAFKTVKKPFSTTGVHPGAQDVTDDKLFIASHYELCGSLASDWSSSTYLSTMEGTQYAWWKSKGATGENEAQPIFSKSFPSGQGGMWWQRSLSRDSDQIAMYVTGGNNPYGANWSNYWSPGTCPCFCL